MLGRNLLEEKLRQGEIGQLKARLSSLKHGYSLRIPSEDGKKVVYQDAFKELVEIFERHLDETDKTRLAMQELKSEIGGFRQKLPPLRFSQNKELASLVSLFDNFLNTLQTKL